MATYNFTTTLTRINGNTPTKAIRVYASLGANPHPDIEFLFNTTLTDTRRLRTKDLQAIQAGFPDFTGDLTSDTLDVFFSTFIPFLFINDAVYQCHLEFESSESRPSDIYTSDALPLLDTTWLTENIPLMPETTHQEICTKDYAQQYYDLIYAIFDNQDPNYIEDTDYAITYTINIVNDLNFNSITLNASFSSNNSIDLNIPDTTIIGVSYVIGGWCNYIEYTVNNTTYEYTWNWNKNISSPQTHTYTNTEDFADGVYKCYTSAHNGLAGEVPYDFPAYLTSGTTYLLRTTTIDNLITGLETCVNQNDPAQVAAYAAILAQQEAVQAAWEEFLASEEPNPAPVNDALAYLQELVANSGITCCSGLSMTLAAGTTDQMVFSYPSLPTGTYSNQSGTLTNSLTGEEYTFTGFPANEENTQLILNSNTIGAGSSFPDGVWQGVVSYEVDGIPYSCTAYALVVTNAKCCVRKAQAKSATCKNLTSKAEELNSWLETAIDEFNYAAYSVSNGFIKKINAVCSSCGCGC